MKVLYHAIFMLAIMFNGAIAADLSPESNFPSQSMGLFVGHASGTGYSYRALLNEDYFWQTAFGYYHSDREAYYSVGASLAKIVTQSSKFRGYILAGTSHSEYYFFDEEDQWRFLYNEPLNHWLGIGPGFEFLVFDHISIIFEVLQGYNIMTRQMYTLPQGGLMYSW